MATVGFKGLIITPVCKAQYLLVEDGRVTCSIFFDDRHDERDQLVPELETLGAVWTLIDSFLWLAGTVVFCLELTLVQLTAVVEQKLVGGLHASLHTVLDHSAGTRRTRQLLDLPRQQNRTFTGEKN